jgi:lauroyl/myristoyl acyltransferase
MPPPLPPLPTDPVPKGDSGKAMWTFFFIGIYGRIVAYLPPWCVSLLCALIARVAGSTSLKSRVERGMRRFPGQPDDDVEDLTRRHIRFLVDVFHNMLYFSYHHRPTRRVRATVKCEGEAYLTEALKSKRGAILFSLHLGDFFSSIAYLATAYPVNLVVRGESNPRWEAFGMRMRQKTGIKTIYSEGGALKIKAQLKEGELVVFVIDQYILPFFYGPDHPVREVVPRVAQLTGAPVIPFFTLHDKGHIILRFLPPLAEVSSSGLEDILMQGIRENPSLWFWWRRLGKIKRSQRKRYREGA